MIAYNTGDYAYDIQNNVRVQILSGTEIWGFVTYRVFRPSDGAVYKLPGDALSATQDTSKGPDEYYIRYVAMLSKIKNETAGGVLTQLTGGIIPLPHQRYALERAISDNNIRYILADEVGLGKTIEAGMIIKELKARGLVKRILIVCPTGLVSQWNMEMREKFNEPFHIILPGEFSAIRKLLDTDDVYGGFDQVISPMDSIKPLSQRAGWTEERVEKYNQERIYSIINSGWDLVIIDEAHRVAGSSSDVARHKLGSLLASASPYLLLLTGTPHSGKTEPFLRLVRLLDEQAFPNAMAIVKEQVAPYIIRTEKRDAIDDNGNRLFKGRTTKTIHLSWDERHTMQAHLYEMVTNYVAKNYNKALRNRGKHMWVIFLLIMMQRLVSSSTRAVRESMERRIRVLQQQSASLRTLSEDEFAAMELEMNMEEAIAAMSFDVQSEIAELETLVAIAKQAEYQYLDAKIEPLMRIVEDLFAEERERKVIIFTEFVATQAYLQELLMGRGFNVSILNGSMDIEERSSVLIEFRTSSDILISTDAGGEGLNLQFSNCVINYDLPWNPMKIEQRIGRVDRIGQQRDVVAYNFVLADTVETRVREVLEEKLSAILNELGVDKYADVLDGEQAELDFTEVYMRSIGDERRMKNAISAVESDFKRQITSSLQTKELLRDDKDLGALAGIASGFDLTASLQAMMRYFDGGDELSLIEKNYSLSDPAITWHLKNEIEFEQAHPLSVVSIKNFPHETGYFMLWDLSVANDEQSRRFIPVFFTDSFLLRPLAGARIWDAFLDERSVLSVSASKPIEPDLYERLCTAARDYAYDTFLTLKNETERRREEMHRKVMYALGLRIEAAERIGIENIRKSKLDQLFSDRVAAVKAYAAEKAMLPEFRPVLIVRMERRDD